MKKSWNWLLYLIILAGFPFMLWAGVSLSIDTYMFWKYGEEKEAIVTSFDHTTSAGKGGVTYYYELQIDSDHLVKGFPNKLPVGKKINVLVLPENPKKITLGNKNSGLFEIASHLLGGSFFVVLALGMFVLLIYMGPSTLFDLLKNRDKYLGR